MAYLLAHLVNSDFAAATHSSNVSGWFSRNMQASKSFCLSPKANRSAAPNVLVSYPASRARCVNVAMYVSRSSPFIRRCLISL